MKVTQSFKLAFKSMSSSKFRTFLTMLGIIIGVAAVIILVSLVGGFSQDMISNFSSMGTNNLTVMMFGRGGTVTVSPDDLMTFVDGRPDLYMRASPVVSLNAVAKKGRNNISASVTGGSETYHTFSDYELENGRLLSFPDVTSRTKTALVGAYVQDELYEGADPVGQYIYLDGQRFTVVGLLAEKGDRSENSADNVILVPYTSAQRLGGNARVNNYQITAASSEVVAEAKTELESWLTEKMGGSDYFYVRSVSEMLDMLDEMVGTLTMILVGIAGISLLVGGIGIMNIMLVSVTERTKEIGIRKSLGGKRRDILLQFVIEAATTSAVGGVIGILFGIGVARIAAGLLEMSSFVSTGAVAVAFSVSVGIGVLFGYYPAAQAAKLNPIDALRYD